MLAKWP